jgi:hypothetical protein
MVLNIGPQHPSTHGVLRIVLELDGEKILRAEPVIGYLHRAAEKLAEHRDHRQVLVLMNRHAGCPRSTTSSAQGKSHKPSSPRSACQALTTIGVRAAHTLSVVGILPFLPRHCPHHRDNEAGDDQSQGCRCRVRGRSGRHPMPMRLSRAFGAVYTSQARFLPGGRGENPSVDS